MNYLHKHALAPMSHFIATKYFPTWLILTVGIIIMLFAAMAIIKQFKKPEIKNKKIIIPTIIILVDLILIGITSSLLSEALSKGAPITDALRTSPYTLAKSNAKTISPSTNVPRDIDRLKGSIIVIYKYGCKRCEYAHDDLQKAIDSAKAHKVQVYTVLVNTDIAQKLIKEVNPTEAPIAVYVRNQPANLSGLKANYVPYININTNGNMTFNQAGWESLLKRQQNQE